MSGPEDEREEGAEDLFEDLDKFFAPIKDTDWPEGEPPAESSEPDADREPDEDVQDDPLLEGLTPDIEIPDELAEEPEEQDEPVMIDDTADEPVMIDDTADEPSPGGEEEVRIPDLDDLFTERDEEASSMEAGVAQTGPREEDAAAEEHPSGRPVEDLEAEDWPSGQTGEMSGEEWDRLRESVGDEEDETVGAAAAVEEGEPGGISLEDMNVAPPQYTGLPGPDEEEASLGEVLYPGGEAEGADIETAEAAAEHFAEGVREGTPEEVERELLADLEASKEGPASVQVEPEEGVGWAETPVEETAEAGAGAEARNLQAAAISGGLLAVAAIALLAIGNGPFVVLAGIVIVLGQGELYAVLKKRGMQPATALGLAIGALMLGGAYLRGEPAVLFGMVLAMGLSVPWYMAAPPESRRGMARNLGATLLGIVYVPFLASFALVLLRAPVVGRNLLLTVVGLTVLYDICAYGIGTLWGERRLAPSISPKKSWEGAIGATMVLLVVALSLVASIDPFTPATAVGLALVIAVAAPLGDLVESTLKRDLGVKDMGTILPGHGGILDRIDSILLAAPAAYYYLLIVL